YVIRLCTGRPENRNPESIDGRISAEISENLLDLFGCLSENFFLASGVTQITTGPATGQETPRCHGPQGAMRGNGSRIKFSAERNRLMPRRFFFFRPPDACNLNRKEHAS